MLVSIKTFLYKNFFQLGMGIFGRLFSRKKKGEDEEDQPGYGEEDEDGGVKTEIPPWSRGYEENFPRRQAQPFQQDWQQPQQPQQQQFQQQAGSHEIIIAKLDVINAKLDSLNQRLANLEKYAADDEKEKNSSRSRW